MADGERAPAGARFSGLSGGLSHTSPVGAIERRARFFGARQGDADAGFADRDLLRPRAVNDPLGDRIGRGQPRDLPFPSLAHHDSPVS